MELRRRGFVDAVILGGPENLIFGQVYLPSAHMRDSLGLLEQLRRSIELGATLSQSFLRALAFGDVGVGAGEP